MDIFSSFLLSIDVCWSSMEIGHMTSPHQIWSYVLVTMATIKVPVTIATILNPAGGFLWQILHTSSLWGCRVSLRSSCSGGYTRAFWWTTLSAAWCGGGRRREVIFWTAGAREFIWWCTSSSCSAITPEKTRENFHIKHDLHRKLHIQLKIKWKFL